MKLLALVASLTFVMEGSKNFAQVFLIPCSIFISSTNILLRTGVHPKHFGPRDINPNLFQTLEEEDIGYRGFSNECSGTDICHFTARQLLLLY